MIVMVNDEIFPNKRAFLEHLLMNGKCERADDLRFDDDFVRHLETWTYEGYTFFVKYDTIYTTEEYASPTGVMVKRNAEVTERVLCDHNRADFSGCTPREMWVVG